MKSVPVPIIITTIHTTYKFQVIAAWYFFLSVYESLADTLLTLLFTTNHEPLHMNISEDEFR